MKKKIIALGLVAISTFSLVGCSREAERVSHNVSQQADNFNVLRRLVVINTRSNEPVFELVGNFSIKVDSQENQLEVICETGKNEYKKHFIGLNDETLYTVEDIGGANVDKYKYEVNFLPQQIVPITVTSID